MKFTKIIVSVTVALLGTQAFAQNAPKKVRKKPAAQKAAPAKSGEVSGALDNLSIDPQEKPGRTYRAANYGLAGCGLGAVVFSSPAQQENKVSQILAATVNNLVSPQTSAITSGTSNCTDRAPDSVARMEQEVFVASNITTLSKEAAQGHGQNLAAFADVLGCNGDTTFSRFSNVTQANYASLFNSSDSNVVLNNFVSSIRADEVLASQCSRVSL